MEHLRKTVQDELRKHNVVHRGTRENGERSYFFQVRYQWLNIEHVFKVSDLETSEFGQRRLTATLDPETSRDHGQGLRSFTGHELFGNHFFV